MKKLDAKYMGPYKITEVISSHAFRLDLPRSFQVHNVFHMHKLEPWKTNTIKNRILHPPPPDIIEGEEEYEAEQILDSRIFGRKYPIIKYQVRWKGYPPEEDTWEPHAHLENSLALLDKFHQQYPDKPKHMPLTDPHKH
jgi:hypothetical protein